MFKIFAFVTIFAATCNGIKYQTVEDNIFFTVYTQLETGKAFVSRFDDDFESRGCSKTSNITIIVHGWKEGLYVTEWVPTMINNFLLNAGGCVIFMDYSRYSIVGDYFNLVAKYELIRDVLIKKLNQIGNYDRIFMFGFSFGSRLAAGAGYNLTMTHGSPQISRMDLCDPAGPGFDMFSRRAVDPQQSSKNTACINTSNDKGTTVYNCHQNFRMGRCGKEQAGTSSYPKRSHGLCPYFYNNAFDYDYVDNNFYNCTSKRLIPKSLTKNMVLGWRNNVFPVGDVFMMTSKCHPYTFIHNIINNYPIGGNKCI